MCFVCWCLTSQLIFRQFSDHKVIRLSSHSANCLVTLQKFFFFFFFQLPLTVSYFTSCSILYFISCYKIPKPSISASSHFSTCVALPLFSAGCFWTFFFVCLLMFLRFLLSGFLFLPVVSLSLVSSHNAVERFLPSGLPCTVLFDVPSPLIGYTWGVSQIFCWTEALLVPLLSPSSLAQFLSVSLHLLNTEHTGVFMLASWVFTSFCF